MATLLGSEAAEVRMKEGESVLEAIARAEQEGLRGGARQARGAGR